MDIAIKSSTEVTVFVVSLVAASVFAIAPVNNSIPAFMFSAPNVVTVFHTARSLARFNRVRKHNLFIEL